MSREEFLNRVADVFYQQIVLSFLKGFALGVVFTLLGVAFTLLTIKLGG